jgi:hypothetical protein
MADALEARLNTRAPKRVKDDLSALAMRRHIDESELTRSLIDEAIRRETYPGVAFRTTSTGRDAAVEGRRLYIWQVMETLWASDATSQRRRSIWTSDRTRSGRRWRITPRTRTRSTG